MPIETAPAYLVGTHKYSFRRGQVALIIGVAILVPATDAPPQPCFKLRFADGTEDFVPIADSAQYTIIGQAEAVNRDSRIAAINADPAPRTVTVRRRSSDVHASLDGIKGCWGAGRTTAEAIGEMVVTHEGEFNLKVEAKQ